MAGGYAPKSQARPAYTVSFAFSFALVTAKANSRSPGQYPRCYLPSSRKSYKVGRVGIRTKSASFTTTLMPEVSADGVSITANLSSADASAYPTSQPAQLNRLMPALGCQSGQKSDMWVSFDRAGRALTCPSTKQ
jgi:hypothetical protein